MGHEDGPDSAGASWSGRPGACPSRGFREWRAGGVAGGGLGSGWRGMELDPSPAQVAGALRAERAVLGDAEVLAIARVLRAELIGAGAAGRAARRAGGHRCAGQRASGRCGWTTGAGCGRRPSSSGPMTTCGVSRSGWRLLREGGWTTRAPTSTRGWPVGSGCTRCCLPFRPKGPVCRCGCRPRHTCGLDDLVTGVGAQVLAVGHRARLAFPRVGRDRDREDHPAVRAAVAG